MTSVLVSLPIYTKLCTFDRLPLVDRMAVLRGAGIDLSSLWEEDGEEEEELAAQVQFLRYVEAITEDAAREVRAIMALGNEAAVADQEVLFVAAGIDLRTVRYGRDLSPAQRARMAKASPGAAPITDTTCFLASAKDRERLRGFMRHMNRHHRGRVGTRLGTPS